MAELKYKSLFKDQEFDIYLIKFVQCMQLYIQRLKSYCLKFFKNQIRYIKEISTFLSLMFLPYFDVVCDLLKDRCTATWNLFVLYNELNFVRIKGFISRKAGESGALPILKIPKKAI